MPWQIEDVDKFNKGLSDADKKKWVAVANSALADCLEDDGEDCEASAIRQANGVVAEQGDGGVEECICPECGHEMDHERGTPCNEIECPECGAMMGPMEETMTDVFTVTGDKAVVLFASNDTGYWEYDSEWTWTEGEYQTEETEPTIRELLAKILGLLEEDDNMTTFTESASGYAIGLAEAAEENGNRAPVEFDLKIIAPGAGNKHDNHWYPADMLKRDAKVFEGVDMFVTDHRENERSERTKVGKIKEIIGFTDDGGPIGRAVIYDPALAEKTRNRAAADELSTLHCSILASGTAKKGKIDGTEYHIVEAIDRADAVDLVSRAGAGGRALALAESETGGESMADEEQVIEEQEELEEVVTISEQEEPESPAPEPLASERVQEIVGESKLPDASKARLSEGEYPDEGSVEEAVKAEIAYIKELTGSGRPFGQGPADPPPEHKPRTVEEADADWKRILSEVGMPQLGGSK